MLPKDFENYELKLKKLREEQREFYETSLRLYEELYEENIAHLIPEDVFDIAHSLKDIFCVQYAQALQSGEKWQEAQCFQKALSQVISGLPLAPELRNSLKWALLHVSSTTGDFLSYQSLAWEFRMDPNSALIESIFLDGKISHDEFLLLQTHYSHKKTIQANITVLSPQSKNVILSDWNHYTSLSDAQKKQDFQKEYFSEIHALEQRGYPSQLLVDFVSQGYFMAKNRKESPKSRLRRTFKIALLKLLHLRNDIDIEALFARFEYCESFDEYFLLFFQLFEILGDGILQNEEYRILEDIWIVKKSFEKVKDTREKILAWEQATMKISNVFSVTDDFLEEKSDAWKQKELYGKIFDDSSYIVGQEIHFEEVNAGILSQSDAQMREKDETDIDTWDTLEWNYERLKFLFFELDEEKRKAFAAGKYDQIDEINRKLFRIQSQLEKIMILLGYIPDEIPEEGRDEIIL